MVSLSFTFGTGPVSSCCLEPELTWGEDCRGNFAVGWLRPLHPLSPCAAGGAHCPGSGSGLLVPRSGVRPRSLLERSQRPSEPQQIPALSMPPDRNCRPCFGEAPKV